jgi:protein SCO1
MRNLRNKSIVISLILLTSVVFFSCTGDVTKVRVLPIVGERDVEYKMVDGVEVADTIYHHVPSFRYLNQDSVFINSKDLKGKIWIADFFFSNCPSICPPMTTNMKRLSIQTKDLSKSIQFLSFSIDPKRDHPTRLREYIKLNGIEATNWYFFTGDQEATHMLAKEFFNGAEQNNDVPGGFGHTPYFALVDTEGLVRGVYDGTDSDAVDRLAKDVRKLLKHEYNIEGSVQN